MDARRFDEYRKTQREKLKRFRIVGSGLVDEVSINQSRILNQQSKRGLEFRVLQTKSLNKSLLIIQIHQLLVRQLLELGGRNLAAFAFRPRALPQAGQR